MNRFRMSLACASSLCLITTAALAKSYEINVTDGQGEQVTLQKGHFHHSKQVIKDRLGDQIQYQHTSVGHREATADILGNEVDYKKGILHSETDAKSVLGDQATYKRAPFKRATNVDVSGIANYLQGLMSDQGQKPSVTPQLTPSAPHPLHLGPSLKQQQTTIPQDGLPEPVPGKS